MILQFLKEPIVGALRAIPSLMFSPFCPSHYSVRELLRVLTIEYPFKFQFVLILFAEHAKTMLSTRGSGWGVEIFEEI